MPLPDEMPWLPIEQLPEDWKDGRWVLIKYEDDVIRIFDALRLSQGYTDGKDHWQGTEPTHFCPIPLIKEV
jgi:hypothetical protein